MRLLGFLLSDIAWIGAIHSDGWVRPLATVDDFYADVDRHLQGQPTRELVARVGLVVVPPVPSTAKVLCAGLNYRAHADESQRPLPEQPDVFARWASTLVGPDQEVPLPHGEPGLDWEAELAAIIGRAVRHVDAAAVEASFLGYTCFNDLSARTHQRASSQWGIGKNADRSGPIGPVVVTPDELDDPYDLRITTRVGGLTMQDSTTAEMIFSAGTIGARAAECMTLVPGDVICTGTPSGIGSKRQPPVFLGAGDRVEVEIESIGILANTISAARPVLGASA